MKLSSLLERARGSILVLLGVVSLAVSLDASAIPVFARQTGFKCVACHVGGMYPQLTSLGRMFKLTGYTLGNRPNLMDLEVQNDYPPVAVMVQAARQYYTNTPVNSIGGKGLGVPTSAFDTEVVSFFAGGKITDNVGAFIQWTGQKYDNFQNGTQGGWQSAGIDNTEFRYADRKVNGDSDLIYGAYVNNRATMSDVWNNMGPWQSGWINYFNSGNAQAVTTFLTGETSQHTAVGTGVYIFKDKTWYGEVALYKSPTHGPFSILTAGSGPSNAAYGSNGTVIDTSPYYRFAYNKEWGPHSFELGLHGMTGYAHGIGVTGNSDYNAPVSTFHDTGIDAQYQYVLEPHYFSAHARVTRENMNNAMGVPNFAAATPSNPTDNLTETYADAIYIYKAKYGAMLSYQGATGSNDTGLYGSAPSGSPNWTAWTPHVFWAPVINMRVGFMYTVYTQMGGLTGNGLTANGVSNLSPHDFNTSMLYVGFIY